MWHGDANTAQTPMRSTVFELWCGDVREVLTTLPDNSVDCIVTSPPYYGLRDYGTAQWVGGDPNCPHLRLNKISTRGDTGHVAMLANGVGVGDAIYKSTCARCGAQRIDAQIGLEPTPQEYIETLVAVFRAARRVLKPEGTLWLNLGDTYIGGGGNSARSTAGPNGIDERCEARPAESITAHIREHAPKNLLGVPWRVALALQDDGWNLRTEIIWHKTNGMPESVKDRPTRNHEYLFLFTRSLRYYYNARAGREQGATTPRNYRTVWSLPVARPYRSGARHYAQFPLELPLRCIRAGCPPNGRVLDPFSGVGTTGVAALVTRRRYWGIELNPEYHRVATQRLEQIAQQLTLDDDEAHLLER